MNLDKISSIFVYCGICHASFICKSIVYPANSYKSIEYTIIKHAFKFMCLFWVCVGSSWFESYR